MFTRTRIRSIHTQTIFCVQFWTLCEKLEQNVYVSLRVLFIYSWFFHILLVRILSFSFTLLCFHFFILFKIVSIVKWFDCVGRDFLLIILSTNWWIKCIVKKVTQCLRATNTSKCSLVICSKKMNEEQSHQIETFTSPKNFWTHENGIRSILFHTYRFRYLSTTKRKTKKN